MHLRTKQGVCAAGLGEGRWRQAGNPVLIYHPIRDRVLLCHLQSKVKRCNTPNPTRAGGRDRTASIQLPANPTPTRAWPSARRHQRQRRATRHNQLAANPTDTRACRFPGIVSPRTQRWRSPWRCDRGQADVAGEACGGALLSAFEPDALSVFHIRCIDGAGSAL